MEHLRQPEGSRLCGQTCVAMLLGITLYESITQNFRGKICGTRTKDVCQALGRPQERLRTFRGTYPERGILKVTWGRKGERATGSHWIVLDGKAVYDPEAEGILPLWTYLRWLETVPGRITSYMEVPK